MFKTIKNIVVSASLLNMGFATIIWSEPKMDKTFKNWVECNKSAYNLFVKYSNNCKKHLCEKEK